MGRSEPVHTFYCHCEHCQKETGGPFATEAESARITARPRIKVLLILGLLLLHEYALAEPGDVTTLPLETGVELRLQEIPPSRILPHAYYDQAMSSIPGIYPQSEIIAKRRIFRLGKGDSASFNSIVCYKKDAKDHVVTISGVSTNHGRAWRFETVVKESLLPEALISVLEELSARPVDQPSEGTPSAGPNP